MIKVRTRNHHYLIVGKGDRIEITLPTFISSEGITGDVFVGTSLSLALERPMVLSGPSGDIVLETEDVWSIYE